jgi:hypothetical protein
MSGVLHTEKLSGVSLTDAEEEAAKSWREAREVMRRSIVVDAWTNEGTRLDSAETEKRLTEQLALRKREREAEWHASRMVRRCAELSGMPEDATGPGSVPLVTFNAYARFMTAFLSHH